MSSIQTSSVFQEGSETYPLLATSQIERIKPFARLHDVQAGQVLYSPGDLSVPLYILLSCSVEIIQAGADCESPIVTLLPSMFTGEAGMIGDQRAVVLARVLESGQVLAIPPGALRSLVSQDALLSEIFLRSFILRRLMLITRELGNVLIIGSSQSPNIARLREFLWRNSHPFNSIDLDTDDGSRALLEKFGVSAAEVPIVIYNGTAVLRNPSVLELADCLGLNDDVRESLLRDLIIVGGWSCRPCYRRLRCF